MSNSCTSILLTMVSTYVDGCADVALRRNTVLLSYDVATAGWRRRGD